MKAEFRIALEITPPRRPRCDILLRRARALGELPDAIHVISRPDRWSSLDAALHLEREGHHAVWHLATRGRTRDEIRAEIERALGGGIRSVLCVRGEHESADKPDTPLIREVVALLRQAEPGLRIGVTANPYGESVRVLRNLRGKLEAGANFVQTQPVFGREALNVLAPLLDALPPQVRLIPMLMPLLDADDSRRAAERLGLPVPARAGWPLVRETLATLAGDERIHGVAVMALRADPEPDLMTRLAREIADPRRTT